MYFVLVHIFHNSYPHDPSFSWKQTSCVFLPQWLVHKDFYKWLMCEAIVAPHAADLSLTISLQYIIK